jgi:hypothetical protein
MSEKIKETAAAGSTGGGSIAVSAGRLGGMRSRMSLKDFMVRFQSKVNNRYRFVPVNMDGSIAKVTESYAHPYQTGDAVSRLKNAEIGATRGAVGMRPNDVITYGIEDDQGVMMKITVPMEQSEEFEQYIAQAMASVTEFKKTGVGEDKSLAELLYELKDQFTIVSAEFPTIPKDAVYNAEEITEDLPDNAENVDDTNDLENLENEPDMDTDSEDGDEEFDPEDEEIGDDFESGGDSKEELLTAVLAMLKSQNEKEIAQANAEAEQAKAKQAELALKSARNEMQTQEELVAAQAEMDAEKEKEKKAKEMAELAKFNYKKKMGESIGASSYLRSALLELDAMDTPQSLRRQMAVLNQKYKVEPDDDPDTVKFKREQFQAARREIRVQMQAAQRRQEYEQKQKDNEKQQDQQQQGNTIGQPQAPQGRQ